jgi:hypothetical protein
VRRALRLTSALYPAMAATAGVAFAFSSRSVGADGLVLDRVFPGIRYAHRPGEGTFVPGSFALNFFLPSLILMLGANLLLGDRVGPLLASRANVFTYLFVLLVAIGEIGTDTVLPLLALPGPWRFRIAVSVTHLVFFAAVALAAAVTRGADREW